MSNGIDSGDCREGSFTPARPPTEGGTEGSRSGERNSFQQNVDPSVGAFFLVRWTPFSQSNNPNSSISWLTPPLDSVFQFNSPDILEPNPIVNGGLHFYNPAGNNVQASRVLSWEADLTVATGTVTINPAIDPASQVGANGHPFNTFLVGFIAGLPSFQTDFVRLLPKGKYTANGVTNFNGQTIPGFSASVYLMTGQGQTVLTSFDTGGIPSPSSFAFTVIPDFAWIRIVLTNVAFGANNYATVGTQITSYTKT